MAFWVDYNIEQGWNRFRVKGDWDKEVMGYDRDGNLSKTKGTLYSPGEVYVVGEDGWLHKMEDVTAMMMKYREGKQDGYSKSD